MKTRISGRYDQNIIIGHVIVLKAKGNKMADVYNVISSLPLLFMLVT